MRSAARWPLHRFHNRVLRLCLSLCCLSLLVSSRLVSSRLDSLHLYAWIALLLQRVIIRLLLHRRRRRIRRIWRRRLEGRERVVAPARASNTAAGSAGGVGRGRRRRRRRVRAPGGQPGRRPFGSSYSRCGSQEFARRSTQQQREESRAARQVTFASGRQLATRQRRSAQVVHLHAALKPRIAAVSSASYFCSTRAAQLMSIWRVICDVMRCDVMVSGGLYELH